MAKTRIAMSSIFSKIFYKSPEFIIKSTGGRNKNLLTVPFNKLSGKKLFRKLRQLRHMMMRKLGY